jgi:hypothetical protein
MAATREDYLPEKQKGSQIEICNPLFLLRILWGGRWGSNPRQQESQSWTLPTELRPPLNSLLNITNK